MKQKPYQIHFVCRGNTYRSRLAAAYMATLLGDRYVVSSSGVGTQRTKIRTSEGYTKAIAKRHHLTHGITTAKTQTTDALLAAADVIVFMNKDVYNEALRKFQFDTRKALVWHIPDISTTVRAEYDRTKDVAVVLDIAEQTFARIRRACNELRTLLTRAGWIDVFGKDNRPEGLRLPIGWVNARGLWHRGIHVVVQTSDGKFVVGKRTSAIIYAPGMLEITLGGYIDSGETPLKAAQRETHEETGLLLPEKLFRPLFLYREASYHPRYKTRSRVHIYTYAVTLPVHSKELKPQPDEVAELRVLTKRQVKHLLRTHRMAHFGRLKWSYQLLTKAVAMSQLPS
jgi:protein-tyrosine-phosphatase/8-oxo-dGTP pyrophosphatase MutT (NUDIX family)